MTARSWKFESSSGHQFKFKVTTLDFTETRESGFSRFCPSEIFSAEPFVARELAPAGLRSGPKIPGHFDFLRALRTRAGASSLATGDRILPMNIDPPQYDA